MGRRGKILAMEKILSYIQQCCSFSELARGRGSCFDLCSHQETMSTKRWARPRFLGLRLELHLFYDVLVLILADG